MDENTRKLKTISMKGGDFKHSSYLDILILVYTCNIVITQIQ